MATQLASTISGPICLLPLKVFAPLLFFSPESWHVGISPSMATNFRSLGKRIGLLSSSVSIDMEVISPNPGTDDNSEKFSLYLSVVLRRRISRVIASISFLMCSTWLQSSMSVRFSSESSSTSSRSHFIKFRDQWVPFLLKRSGYTTPCV